MKLPALIAIVAAILIAAVVGFAAHARKVQDKAEALAKELVAEKKRAAVYRAGLDTYRRRAEALQHQLERHQQAAAAENAAVSAALAENQEWANQALPPEIAAAVNQRPSEK